MATYKEAGVDIDAGEEAVRRITGHVRGTFTPGVLTDVGAFGGMFSLAQETLRDPVLVSSMDGVGTKLKVAQRVGKHDTVGHDLVNHCVNDIAVSGARPLFFLDYFAAASLQPNVLEAVVKGFAAGCTENGCALIGGETAEMPDLYKPGEYDLAGTIVGVVERDEIVDGSAIQAGDRLLGLRSSGLHTNGYSLARKVLFDRFVAADTPDALGGETVAEALLHIHRSYLDAIGALRAEGLATGFAHITGGGLVGNTSRILPDGLALDVDWGAWSRPALFELIQEVGEVPEDDMRRTFNLGVGLVAIVPAAELERARLVLGALGEPALEIGTVVDA